MFHRRGGDGWRWWRGPSRPGPPTQLPSFKQLFPKRTRASAFLSLPLYLLIVFYLDCRVIQKVAIREKCLFSWHLFLLFAIFYPKWTFCLHRIDITLVWLQQTRMTILDRHGGQINKSKCDQFGKMTMSNQLCCWINSVRCNWIYPLGPYFFSLWMIGFSRQK